jgi:transposase
MRPVALRELTADELAAVKKLAQSRTASARRLERARIIQAVQAGQARSSIAARLDIDLDTVRQRVLRFNAGGLASLDDQPRSGRPATYSADVRAAVIAAALTDPKTLDLPFAAWTLDRLAAYLAEHKSIGMKRSRIDEILRQEGLRWRRHETWFGERLDPDFAEKRGRSRRSTRLHPRAASWCAWTRWGPSAPRAIRDTCPFAHSIGPQQGAPNRRSTMAGAARVTSSARSVRRPVRP